MKLHRSLALLPALLATPALAGSQTIDFESYVHGQIMNTQEAGVTISGINVGGGPDLAVVFDSRERQTRDRDLEGPNGSDGSWTGGGNIAPNTNLGNLLIIQENSVGIEDGIADRPDDEGSRPAGSIIFEFDKAISSFGFDLIDVEGPSEFGKDSGFFATFFGAFSQVRVSFADFITPGTDFYDSSVSYGDNSANRIAPITAASIGLDSFDRVEINFGGSAAIDNVQYTAVPTPGALAGAGLLRRPVPLRPGVQATDRRPTRALPSASASRLT